MRSSNVGKQLLVVYSILCIISSLYLYSYPLFHRCDFPQPSSGLGPAPFRLLVFADPQLEGDTSLPSPNEPYLPLVSEYIKYVLKNKSTRTTPLNRFIGLWHCLYKDLVKLLSSTRKRIDLIGNDYYLAHVYRTMHRHTKPTHVTVLGDLLGSQWISDDEFGRRATRFWNIVFRGGARISSNNSETVDALGTNSFWANRIINVAGNHDIGYAGDIKESHIVRFEQSFGKVNQEIQFHVVNTSTSRCSGIPVLRLIVLNSMNLDAQALTPSLQTETYKFVNEVITSSRPVEDRCTFTILLTHIPLHKDASVCVDPPFFDYYSPGEKKGGIREQNHLSSKSGKGILEGIYGMSGNRAAPAQGMGRNGIILTGHDHEGCDVYHHIIKDKESNETRWAAIRWKEAKIVAQADVPGIREITVRSMMGEFGGNSGLLSAWFDEEAGEWSSAFSTCSLGVQHVWWTIHIADLVAVLLWILTYTASIASRPRPSQKKNAKKPETGPNEMTHSASSNIVHTKTVRRRKRIN